MLESGVPAVAVAAIVGHSSPAFTMAQYAASTPGMVDQAVQAMDARYNAA